jgi:hypothetical protein
MYSYDTLLKRLAQDLEDMPPELRQFIEEEHAVVRQRHLARHGDVPAADQPHSRHGIMPDTERAARDHTDHPTPKPVDERGPASGADRMRPMGLCP